MKKRYTAMVAAVLLTAGVLAGCGSGSQSDIGQDQAQSIALEDVGVSESDVSRLKVSKERDDGMLQYDVQFDVEGKEYSYEINGENGEILSSEVENVSGTVQSSTSSQNTNAADSTGNAGTTDNSAGTTDSSAAASTTDNSAAAGSSANTGNNGAASNNTQNAANVAVSEADARQAALERVPGATDADIRMELEFDDGYYIYEGDIIYQQVEYEFEIDAQTGNFLKWSEDRN
ncbi:MAG TPA: PepSY domain-containing protein [Candidatus Blautia gallistercoris]|uniref:PepSY domain-containing protein n=1 Tax=Candidatus Blautia gallistercoris TaxID=2838490 RepID=A0A9D1WJD4_9FIRM|nr:PepSY domain-containing protein [Candidatus Blautia gallistercoris]